MNRPILPNDKEMGYPRVCAHRGFSKIAPENSLPAFGAAVALGAEEIEFDLRATKDDVIISLHDPSLERTSDGTGAEVDHTYEELLQYDFGYKFHEDFRGLKVITFEDILRKFAGLVIMNIHIQIRNVTEAHLKEIIALIRKYDCADYCYFMVSEEETLKKLQELAPDIARCAGEEWGKHPDYLLEKAVHTGCTKIQLFTPFFPRYEEEFRKDYLQDMVKKAHEKGISCNLCIADDPKLARYYLDSGVDTLLTNDFLKIAICCEEYRKKEQ